MTIISADVTDGVKKIISELLEKGLYKSQSEVVRDAVRHLAFKYDIKVKEEKVKTKKQKR